MITSLKYLSLLTLAILPLCSTQVPPLEEQHFFNPGLFNSAAASGIPFADEMFRIVRTGPSEIGSDVSFSCQLPSGQKIEKNTYCVFYAPNGKTLFTNGTNVYDEEKPPGQEPIPNMKALLPGVENNICGINITSITAEYFGKWNCLINRGLDTVPEHRGDFTILTKEELFVRDVRLPRHVVPEHYDLHLTPFIEVDNFTTSGTVKLTFSVVFDNTWYYDDVYTKIYLHSKDIAIDESSVVVKTQAGKELRVKGHEYGFERDFYVIHLGEQLPFGEKLTLEMSFTSYLNDYLVGFYRSEYKVGDDTKYLAVTQFESHYARQAFPCLDEPDKKATFSVSLTTKKEMIALSNMNQIRLDPVEGDVYQTTVFAESVPMSTYLVAFLVSDFNDTENRNNSNYKIWHQPSKTGQAELAAEYGAKILEFYEKFFGIPYPLPKTDMAAIPDFSAGAMENWGLITYRETLLLYVEGISDATNKEDIIKVMAHELAHQWFGNLVTMKWWTDLWLNEGFATYTQYHGIQAVFNESQVRDRMVIIDVQNVMGMDALENSAALSQEVTNPRYDAEFGSIAYSKGCSILRMAENFLTLETFKKGVTLYLNSTKFGNAERDDLWQALTDAAREDNRLPAEITVKDIMDGWTLEPGYPVLKVVKSEGNFIQLSQKRFYLNPDVENPSNVTWTVPVNVAYPNSDVSDFKTTVASEWMLKSTKALNLEIEQRPYVINVQETGFYRVNYDEQNWNDLQEILLEDHDKINELNRAQILDDSLNLARSNQLDYDIALGLTEYLSNEKNYIPWQSALRSFSFIDLMLNDNSSLEEYGYLKAYLTNQLTPLYDELGFDGQEADTHVTILNRRSVLTWLCRYGQEESVNKSKTLFATWMKKPENNIISADLRDVVYSTAIRLGGKSEWEFLWDQFLKVKIDSERLKLIYALGVSTDQSLIERYLDETLGYNLRLQDVVYVYRGIGAQAPGRRFQFEWLQKNWDKVKEKFQGRFDDYMFNLISGYAAAANTDLEIKKLEDFLDEKMPELGSVISDIRRSIETAKINQKWMNDNKEKVSTWFKSRVETSGSSKLNNLGMIFSIFLLTLLKAFAY